MTVLCLAVCILTAFGPAGADEALEPLDDAYRHVTGVILAVSYTTGDMLVYQDSGSVIAVYGLERTGILDIGAGDRVAVTFGPDLEVERIQKMAVTSMRYE